MSNYLYLVITCVIGSQVSHYITKEEDVMWFELPELLPNPVAVVLKSASTQKWGGYWCASAVYLIFQTQY